jgi:hypothetical protein
MEGLTSWSIAATTSGKVPHLSYSISLLRETQTSMVSGFSMQMLCRATSTSAAKSLVVASVISLVNTLIPTTPLTV